MSRVISLFLLASGVGCDKGSDSAGEESDADTDADTDTDTDTDVEKVRYIEGTVDVMVTDPSGKKTRCDTTVDITGEEAAGACLYCDFTLDISSSVASEKGTDCDYDLYPLASLVEGDLFTDVWLAWSDSYAGGFTNLLWFGFGQPGYPGPYWGNLIAYDGPYSSGTATYTSGLLSWTTQYSQYGFTVPSQYCEYYPGYYNAYDLLENYGGNYTALGTLDCGHRVPYQTWTFDGVDDGYAYISLDTISSDTSFDPLFYVMDSKTCIIGNADENFACSFPPPSGYLCPSHKLATTNGETYTVLVYPYTDCNLESGTTGEYLISLDTTAILVSRSRTRVSSPRWTPSLVRREKRRSRWRRRRTSRLVVRASQRPRWLAYALVMLLPLVATLAHAGELELETIRVGQVERTFYVHEPPGSHRDLPLVLVFHGGGGSGSQKGKGMARLTELSELADQQHFRVVYPNSVSGNWNDGRVFDGAATSDDVGFVDAILAHYASTTDARRIYATGASNGGFFTLRLACERADRFAAFAPVIATLPTTLECKPSQPVSVLFLPGTKDPWVHWDGGPVANARGSSRSVDETIRIFSEVDRCPPAAEGRLLPDADPDDGTRVRETRRACADGSEVVLLAVEGGGHTWPGGFQYLPKSIIGATSRDIDASVAIWKFFSSHTLSPD